MKALLPVSIIRFCIEFLDLLSIQHSIATATLDAAGIDRRSGEIKWFFEEVDKIVCIPYNPCMAYDSHEKYVAWCKKNPEKIRAKYKRWYDKHYKSYSAKRKLQMRAKDAVHDALLSGKLERKSCERCGNQKVEAHHPDYSKPLDVRWLCHFHHREQHTKLGSPFFRNHQSQKSPAQLPSQLNK